MNQPICPATAEHGEMVEIFETGLFYCYDCKAKQWLRNARRLLQEIKSKEVARS